MTQAKTESWGRILNGRVAVVTGAARGIGRSAAVALAHSGANVVGIDICAVVDPRSGVEPATRAELDQTGDMVKSEGVQWKSFVLDQRDLPALRKTAETINAEFGHIDILFANAGIQAFRPLLQMEDPDWHIQIDVNLTGVFLCGREAAERMIRRGCGGVIINISSISRHGNAGQTNYSAAKAGVAALSVVWAKELARYGIRTGTIAPGGTRTEILSSMRPEMLEKLLAPVPLQRLGEPEEIAAAAAFIVSNDFFTGRCVDLDGGFRI